MLLYATGATFVFLMFSCADCMGEAGVHVKVTQTDFEGALINVAVFGKSDVFS